MAAYHLSRLKARNPIGSVSLLVYINPTPSGKSRELGKRYYVLYSLGSSEHSTASRTPTSGAEFVIIVMRVQNRPTSQAGLQRLAYGQKKANGKVLLFQVPRNIVGVVKRCLDWFWIRYPTPSLTMLMYLEDSAKLT